MIRYMNDAGLRRKFRIEAYRERIEQMAEAMQDEISPLPEGMDSSQRPGTKQNPGGHKG
jgi:hypothetical protein